MSSHLFIYLFMVNKEQYSVFMALVWLQVSEPPGARHTVSLFSVLISGPCKPTSLFLFSLLKFFCKQLNSPGRKGERKGKEGEDVYQIGAK